MYKLSRLAVEDFRAIYEYTLIHFGVRQAEAYADGLEDLFRLLSNAPQMGYECPEIGDGVRRQDHQRHAIFYEQRKPDIFVVRILHQQMEPGRHLFEPEGGLSGLI